MPTRKAKKQARPFAELVQVVAPKLRPPFGIVLGSPGEVADLVQKLPAGDVTAYQMDLFQSARLREIFATRSRSAIIETRPDLWDLPGTFQTLIYPVPLGGERALKLDMIEQAFHILEPHGDHYADHLSKAQGLARYALKHADGFGRIEMIRRLTNGKLERLDMQEAKTRGKVLKATLDRMSANTSSARWGALLEEKILVCRRLPEVGIEPGAARVCLGLLEAERPVACTECAARTRLGDLETHLRRAHGIYQFRGLRRSFSETRDAVLEVVSVNLDSMFNMCRGVIDGMRDRSYGRILNISSINGQKGQMGQTNYSAAKAGIIGFTKALAQETAKKGITVNVIAPGYIDTEMLQAVPQKVLDGIIATIPVGRLGKTEEIAKMVCFLAAEDAGFITGATMTVNGAQYIAG